MEEPSSPSSPTKAKNKTKKQASIATTAALFRTRMCKFFLEDKCTKGDQCNFAHEETTLRELPNLIKTMMCQDEFCSKGQDCRFAHSAEELRTIDEGESKAVASFVDCTSPESSPRSPRSPMSPGSPKSPTSPKRTSWMPLAPLSPTRPARLLPRTSVASSHSDCSDCSDLRFFAVEEDVYVKNGFITKEDNWPVSRWSVRRSMTYPSDDFLE